MAGLVRVGKSSILMRRKEVVDPVLSQLAGLLGARSTHIAGRLTLIRQRDDTSL
jgi:hypothetical protein